MVCLKQKIRNKRNETKKKNIKNRGEYNHYLTIVTVALEGVNSRCSTNYSKNRCTFAFGIN